MPKFRPKMKKGFNWTQIHSTEPISGRVSHETLAGGRMPWKIALKGILKVTFDQNFTPKNA